VVAVVGIDAKLVDDFKGVFAPVVNVDQSVVERSAVVACEAVAFAQSAGSGKDIRGDDFVEEAGELTIGQVHMVQCLKFVSEIRLQCGTVTNVFAVFVFEALEYPDETIFDVVFADNRS